MHIIRQNVGELFTLIGTGTFVYNLFNFSFTDSEGSSLLPKLPKLGADPLGNVAYFYDQTTLALLSVGAMLIVTGLLIIRKK